MIERLPNRTGADSGWRANDVIHRQGEMGGVHRRIPRIRHDGGDAADLQHCNRPEPRADFFHGSKGRGRKIPRGEHPALDPHRAIHSALHLSRRRITGAAPVITRADGKNFPVIPPSSKCDWGEFGARERTRTSTTLRSLAPEASASASSATRAQVLDCEAFSLCPSFWALSTRTKTVLFGSRTIASSTNKTPRSQVFCVSSMNAEDWKFEYRVLYSA